MAKMTNGWTHLALPLPKLISEAETAPSGMLARGTYKVKSKFIDDDKEEHASWEWNIEIAKSW